jgi:P2-related tail formation protein
MVNLSESNITDILPDYFTAMPEVKALSYAISNMVCKLLSYSDTTSIYSTLDSADDNVLDMLAAEFDAQYYATDLDIESKRKIVKNAIVWHMSAGTPAAVEELITAVFGEGSIQEWPEYGDEPYFFKIKTNAQMTENMNSQFNLMLRKVINTRSHLRGVEIHRENNQVIYPCFGVLTTYIPAAIRDGCYKENRDIKSVINSSVAGSSAVISPAITEKLSIKQKDITAALISGTGTIAVLKQPELREKLDVVSKSVKQAISAALAADSIYKNTIKE